MKFQNFKFELIIQWTCTKDAQVLRYVGCDTHCIEARIWGVSGP
jgi:hypothetical protein